MLKEQAMSKTWIWTSLCPSEPKYWEWIIGAVLGSLYNFAFRFEKLKKWIKKHAFILVCITYFKIQINFQFTLHWEVGLVVRKKKKRKNLWSQNNGKHKQQRGGLETTRCWQGSQLTYVQGSNMPLGKNMRKTKSMYGENERSFACRKQKSTSKLAWNTLQG